jgi:hypothetical protein
MERQFTRRRFNQVVIAGAVVMTVGDMRSHVLAQIAPSAAVIIGVRLGVIPSPNANTDLDSDAPDTDAIIPETSTTRKLILESFNLVSGQFDRLPGPQIPVQSNEKVSGCTFLANGRLVIAITDASTNNKQPSPTRLVTLGPSLTPVAVSGLKKHEELRSIVGIQDGQLLGFVMKKNGTPPVRLVEVDWQTGKVIEKGNLPGNQRISNLASCPDGTLYTIGVDKDGQTSLLRLDVQKRQLDWIADLKHNGKRWDNGLDSLVCSPTQQFFALGALRYEYPKALYSVEASSGAMTKLVAFDATKMTMPA